MNTKIDDQAFIDLIFKYLKVGFGEFQNRVANTSLGMSRRGSLSVIVANIYMIPFDKWVENHLIPKCIKGKRKRVNQAYLKIIRSGKVFNHSIHRLYSHD